MSGKEEFVKKVKDEGMEAGLGFEIETEIGDIPEETDLVLLMARKAGFGEIPLDERIFERIKKVKEMGFRVGVDGGVNLENLKKLKNLEVDVVYSGSQYFELVNANK